VVGYALADYLEQHFTHIRALRPVPDPVWHVLTAHTHDPDDLTALSHVGDGRGRLRHAEALLRAAIGNSPAVYQLVGRLLRQPGREGEVEQAFRDAAASVHPEALYGLGDWLAPAAGAGGRGRAGLSGRGRGWTPARLAWALRDERVTSVLIGASGVAQLDDNLGALENLAFTADELARIDQHAVDGGIDLWSTSSSA
jgi:hypothetical protein